MIVFKYFTGLSDVQQKQFSALGDLYTEWNQKINVISRKDIDNLYERHVLHSLGLTKMLQFKPGSKVMDVGTGGGFPAIPLAIMYPEVHFHLVDSINKKLTVAANVAEAIGLSNISLRHCRVEEEKEKFDFVVSRAVMPLKDLVKLSAKNVASKGINALPNGIICLKGGELQEEIKPFRNIATVIDLDLYFEEEFFKTKKVIYVPV